MILNLLVEASAVLPPAHFLHFSDLHLNPVAIDLGFFKIRWYSLAYISGILLAWFYLNKLIMRPGAPLAKRHTEDLVFWCTLGVILGGRLGYALFYKPEMFVRPLELVRVWEGGMSFHGGALGVLAALAYISWRSKLNLLSVMDYISCAVPIGLFLGRLANFVNGELWGRMTDVPWAMIFPDDVDALPRHPSQLYEAGWEGLLLFTVLNILFWRTDARLRPGRLCGTFIALYGAGRFLLENFRQPDKGLEHLSWGLTMGQTLCFPMVLAGLALIIWSYRRRVQV